MVLWMIGDGIERRMGERKKEGNGDYLKACDILILAAPESVLSLRRIYKRTPR